MFSFRLLLFSATLVLILSGTTSCVTQQKYDALKSEKDSLAKDMKACSEKRKSLIEENERLQKLTKQLKDQNQYLIEDTTQMGKALRKQRRLHDQLNKTHEKLLSNYKELLSNSATKTRQLSENLAEREQELQEAKKNLEQREARIAELQKILDQKEQAVNQLKKRVSDALLSFKGSDLSIEVKNGKVYVSMAEKLLFQSGKYQVDDQGKEALQKLSDVLTKQEDVNIMVEGHTDDVPIASGTDCMNDNWDLSVLRATSIVRILQDDGVSPERLIAAGRGKHKPLVPNNSKENRRKNRRTEIILTPELNELFKILERN